LGEWEVAAASSLRQLRSKSQHRGLVLRRLEAAGYDSRIIGPMALLVKMLHPIS